jgi:hypothetical protein
MFQFLLVIVYKGRNRQKSDIRGCGKEYNMEKTITNSYFRKDSCILYLFALKV